MPYFNPKLLKEETYNERKYFYKTQKIISKGESYRIFEIPELGGIQSKEDYYNPDIFRSVLELKQGLLFSQEIEVKFEDNNLQKVFDDLNDKYKIKQKLQDGFLNSLIFGDSLFKFRYSKRKEAVMVDRVLPENWIAEYNENNVDEEAENNTIIFEKTIKENKQEKKYTLAETFSYNEKDEPIIVYEAFDNQNEHQRVNVLKYFPELANQLVDTNQTNDLELVRALKTEENIFFKYKNRDKIGEYYGQSDLSVPVISMLKSLERKLNLIEYLAKQKVFPAMEMDKDLLKSLTANIKKNIISNNDLLDNNGEVDVSKAEVNTAKYPSRIDYAINSRTIEDLAVYSRIQKSLIGVDGKATKTAYIMNPTNLDELREQIKANLDDLMNALDIAKVYYRPSEISGQTTGVALKVSSINTNIFIQNTKQKYQPFLKKMIYCFLDFAKNEANIIDNEIEYPSVTIKEMNFEDYNQKVQNWINLFDKRLASQLQAIQDLYHLDEAEAEALIEEMGGEEKETPEQKKQPKNVAVSPDVDNNTKTILKALKGEAENQIDTEEDVN